MLWLLLACRVAEVNDVCEGAEPDTAVCIPCEGDEDCGLMGNPCLDSVDCAHVDAVLSYPAVYCSRVAERRWPSDAGCRCVDGLCSWTR